MTADTVLVERSYWNLLIIQDDTQWLEDKDCKISKLNSQRSIKSSVRRVVSKGNCLLFAQVFPFHWTDLSV